jgi:hypothetical protein
MYNLTLDQNGCYGFLNQPKEACFFMPHPYGQCEHFNQVEPFEKL